MMRVSDNELSRARRALILFCQGIFKIKEPQHYRWSENDDETEIYIAGSEPISDSISTKVPRIMVSTGPMKWASLSRDQLVAPPIVNNARTFRDLLTSTATFAVTAKEEAEAIGLAMYVFKLLPLFEGDLNRMGSMHAIQTQQAQIIPPPGKGASIPGSARSEFRVARLVVPIYVEVVFERLADENIPIVRRHIATITT